MAKNSNTIYSSFWMNDDFTFEDYDVLTGITKKNKGKDLFKLASYKRAISNFVRITTNKDIPVSYSTKGGSYTDGDQIVLSAGMKDSDFDSNVGLSLHEASHIALTNFALLRTMLEAPDEISNLWNVLSKISNGRALDNHGHGQLQTIKNLFNYIEDRRIDLYMYTNAPGYKGYYLSMYDKYFHSRVVDKGLRSNEKRTEDWDSYMFRIINLTNSNRDLNALKGLKEIYKAVGFKNIGRLKTSKDALDVAIKIFKIVEKHIEENRDKEPKGDDPTGKGGNEAKMKTPDSQLQGGDNTDDQNGNDCDFTVLGNGDIVPSENVDKDAPELSDSQKKQLLKAIEKQKRFQNGDIKKSNLSKGDNKKLTAIQESGSELKNVGSDASCDSYYNNGKTQKGTNLLIVDKITDAVISSNIYANIIDESCNWHGQRFGAEEISEGIILGKLLGKKLKMRNEERSTVYSRLGNGKIDKRLIAGLGHGYERVFYNVETDKFNNASIHISIDGSGSMGGDKWKQAAKGVVAIATAANMIQGLDVTVSYRSTESVGNEDVAAIFILYKSKRDHIRRLYKILPTLTLNGTTPEGLCFEGIQKLIDQGSDNHDSYFINLSDGQPYFQSKGFYYSGLSAAMHTKRQCDKMRANGIKILSYFISSKGTPSNEDQRSFKRMYGSDSSFVDCTGLAGLAKSLNEMFLTK
jgi:hypothetical protein